MASGGAIFQAHTEVESYLSGHSAIRFPQLLARSPFNSSLYSSADMGLWLTTSLSKFYRLM